jgi:hypothetical protein
MPDWLNRWIGKRPAESPLALRLHEYPPYDAPFAGYGAQLSVEQAQANLAHFERVLPQRLDHLGGLLRELAGVDVAPALAAPREQAGPLADTLHTWAAAQWPALHAKRPAAGLQVWLASPRSGGDIVFSLLLDVAMLLGELVRRANPDWRWALDLDPVNLRDDMVSARRVVLLAEPVGEMRTPFLIDVEDVVVHRFLHPGDPAQRRLNPWRRLVDEGIRGDAMAYWRTTAPPS